MKNIKDMINEATINEAKLNIYTMTAKGPEENWAIVAASNLSSAIEICKSEYGEAHEWLGIEIPELKLASFRSSVPGIITSRFVNRPAK
jgi:predicted transcriptional regulator